MLSLQREDWRCRTLWGKAETPAGFLGQGERDLHIYRSRTMALLRRYSRASVEVGRLPSLLGREFFRARITSYSMKNFEDIVIFVADMERSLDQLSHADRSMLAMSVLEGCSIPDVSVALSYSRRTAQRQLQQAIDKLSQILLETGLLEGVGNK